MKELPDRSDVVGTWRLDSSAQQVMREQARFYPLARTSPNDHEIQLRPDGSCYFRSYWAFQEEDDYIETSQCTWELTLMPTAAGGKRVRAAIELDLEPRSNRYVVTSFWLVREGGRLIMWQYLGDPDLLAYIDFHV
jgi:hypothetical protein